MTNLLLFQTCFQRRLLAAALLLTALAGTASAAVLQHTFNISGDGGETGTGTFTWDDTVVPSGSALNLNSTSISANVLSISISISGGNAVGGSTQFTKADCTGAILDSAPDFTADINFWCNNGTNTLSGIAPSVNDFNGVSQLTFTSGTTAPLAASAAVPVPSMHPWGLGLMAGLLVWGAAAHQRRRW
ncbi:IPTL-CTERM sorting domain-containing protein [Ottowia sp.]|uniref:IPTL-CTERM sorting domain-containing protein n=1 Tax=Ottowia sp. TaxID=1898956 RepID=UPI003A87D7C7